MRKEKLSNQEPIIVVDCHAVGHASKHSYGGLSYGGVPTGVLFGFLIRILGAADKFQSRNFVFAWDSGRSFRKDIYPGYKRKDQELTEEEKELNHLARIQFSMLRMEILPELGFKNIFIQTGIEADDIIASVVIHNEGRKIVMSDDRDLYQLLDHCDLFKLKKKEVYTRDSLKKEWDCTPEEWKWVKVYAGCTGDAVPNIPRVKEKTAIKYLHGTLSASQSFKINEYCKDEKEFLERNKKLTWLPFPNTNQFLLSPFEPLDRFSVMRICERYGFGSLLKGRYNLIWDFLCE